MHKSRKRLKLAEDTHVKLTTEMACNVALIWLIHTKEWFFVLYLIARRSCESEKLENSRAQSTPRRASLFFCPLLFFSITTGSIPLLWSSSEERRARGEGEGLLSRSKEEALECRKTVNVEDAHESWWGETARRSWGQRCSSIIIDTCEWLNESIHPSSSVLFFLHTTHIMKKYGPMVSSLGVFL